MAGIMTSLMQIVMAYKQKVTDALLILEWIYVVALVGVSTGALFYQPLMFELFKLGGSFGTLAALLLTAALIPGILARLGIFQEIRIMLMAFRRHFGIGMYLSALTHSTFLFWLPTIKFGPSPIMLFQVFGLLASLTALPLILTSNDFAVRVLKTWWRKLHKLVYATLFFATVHVLLVGETVGWVLLATLLLIIASYIAEYIRKHASNLPRE